MTSQRMVLINDNHTGKYSKRLHSFELPYGMIFNDKYIDKTATNDPSLQGGVKMAQCGSLPSDPEFKIFFSGGASPVFLPLFKFLINHHQSVKKESQHVNIEEEVT